MRAALATTYEALESEEQELWKRLSTFRGGSTFRAAHEISAYGSIGEDAFEHALGGLIERSIVSLDAATAGGRYRMLEPLRLFGVEQAQHAGEQRQLRHAHLTWCSTLIPPDAWTTGKDQHEVLAAAAIARLERHQRHEPAQTPSP